MNFRIPKERTINLRSRRTHTSPSPGDLLAVATATFVGWRPKDSLCAVRASSTPKHARGGRIPPSRQPLSREQREDLKAAIWIIAFLLILIIGASSCVTEVAS